jgi:hypothetical protein
MILFAVRGFRVGRELESVFEQAVDALERAPPPPQPDPQQQKVAAEMQRDREAHAMDMQGRMVGLQAHQARAQADTMKAAAQAAAAGGIAPGRQAAATPMAHPLPGLRQATDGNHYLPDPHRPGKYLMLREERHHG